MHAETGRRSQVGEAEIARVRKNITGVEEGHPGESLHRRDAQLRVQHDLAVAAGRKSCRRDRRRSAELIEGEPADGRIAAREETFAGRQVILRGTDRDGSIRIDDVDDASKAVRHADTYAGRQYGAARNRQPEVVKRLHERLHEPHLRADRLRGHVGRDCEQGALGGIEQIVAAVANQRVREVREAHLREQPVDQHRVLVRQEHLVEQFRVLERVAHRRAVHLRQAPAELRAHLARPEVEARSNRLVQDSREQQVGARVEHLRLAIGGKDTVFVEPVIAGRGGRRGAGIRGGGGRGRGDEVARSQAHA